MAKKMTAEQALSRIHNIARGMVSPQYVKAESASRKMNASRGMKKAAGGKISAKKKMAYGGTAKKKR